jgi:hypothetical protein
MSQSVVETLATAPHGAEKPEKSDKKKPHTEVKGELQEA